MPVATAWPDHPSLTRHARAIPSAIADKHPSVERAAIGIRMRFRDYDNAVPHS